MAKFRFTIVGEYEVNERSLLNDYGTEDLREAARVDQDQWAKGYWPTEEILSGSEVSYVTIVPVEDVA